MPSERAASGASMRERLADRWPEYGAEALGLGTFMVLACVFTALLEHPGSPLRPWLPHEAWARRLWIAPALGLTAIGLIYSPWGKRSGAHMNPAVTLAFMSLGRISRRDAVLYAVAQAAGALLGLLSFDALAPRVLAHPSVGYLVTEPGPAGWAVAMAAELAMSFGIMLAVLTMGSRRAFERYAGVGAGALVAIYIAIEAPYSGMSMNPARTAASALLAGRWTAWWVYAFAPPVGMLGAAWVHARFDAHAKGACAKLCHSTRTRCIFCGFRPPP